MHNTLAETFPTVHTWVDSAETIALELLIAAGAALLIAVFWEQVVWLINATIARPIYLAALHLRGERYMYAHTPEWQAAAAKRRTEPDDRHDLDDELNNMIDAMLAKEGVATYA